RLNEFGYCCDMFTLDAKLFLPQSRPRLFILATQHELAAAEQESEASILRPGWIHRFKSSHRTLRMQFKKLAMPRKKRTTLADCIQHLGPNAPIWWEGERLNAFLSALSPIQFERLDGMRSKRRLSWATAYRRTRSGRP